MRICICGCGLEIPWKPHHKYHPPSYYPEHQRPFARLGKFKPGKVCKSTCYTRSKMKHKSRGCSWKNIGHCKGRIDVCHLNGDIQNNEASNLISLCRSHHRLLDHGKINPGSPKMPRFYTDSGGKRRYAKSSE